MKLCNRAAATLVLLLHAHIVMAGQTVSVKGMPPERLEAYYAGVAKVVESSAKFNFIVQKSGSNEDNMVMFLVSNALNPVSSVIELPPGDGQLSFFKEGAVNAAQLYGVSSKKSCLSPSTSLNREDVKEAINSKFDGEFDAEYLGILVVGALEAFSEKYPCN